MATASTLSKWLRVTIELAYSLSGKTALQGITGHSIWGAATSAAYEGHSSLGDICRVSTWSSAHTFIMHYKVDVATSAEACFGRKIVQKVVED